MHNEIDPFERLLTDLEYRMQSAATNVSKFSHWRLITPRVLWVSLSSAMYLYIYTPAKIKSWLYANDTGILLKHLNGRFSDRDLSE